MRIAQIAPIIERIPPKKYGGIERVVYYLTEELVKKGHDVTLFASGNSLTSAKLVSVFPKSLREARLKDIYGPNLLTLYNLGVAYSRAYKFDIIHDHTEPIGTPLANISSTPTVMTLHGAIIPENKKLFETLNRPYYVSISKAQRKPAPKLHYIGNVYNGIDSANYPFSNSHEGYLLFVGRISMEKGVHHAITVAQYLNLPLIIAAKLDDVDKPYYQEYIEPYLSDQIKWIGEVTEAERNKLMSKALCFLHPVIWPEPFGLSMIEAMACGCPVVAFSTGSIPEVVVNGKTGYIVKEINSMVTAVDNINKINRQECRDYARTKFNATRMADEYEKIYLKILSKQPHKEKQHKKSSQRKISPPPITTHASR